MNTQQMNAMQIHEPLPRGMLQAVESEDFAALHMGEQAIHDDLDWEEYVSSDISADLADTLFTSLSY